MLRAEVDLTRLSAQPLSFRAIIELCLVPKAGIFGLFGAIQREWLLPQNYKHLKHFQGILGFSRSCGDFPLYAATYRATYRDSELTGSSCRPFIWYKSIPNDTKENLGLGATTGTFLLVKK